MKISRRNFLKVLGSATMAGALAACGGSSSTSAAVSGAASTAAAAAPGTTYTMNIGSVMSASHPSIVALQSFEKAVEDALTAAFRSRSTLIARWAVRAT